MLENFLFALELVGLFILAVVCVVLIIVLALIGAFFAGLFFIACYLYDLVDGLIIKVQNMKKQLQKEISDL